MDQRSTKVNTAWLIAALPVVFFLVNIYRMRGGSAALYIAALAAAGAPGFPALILRRERLTPFILFSAVYTVTLGLNMALIGNIDPGSFVTSILLLGMTAVMLHYGWTKTQGAAGFYASAAIIALALMTRSKTRIFGSSNNYISVILLLAVTLYYCPIAARKRKLTLIDLAPAAVCFGLSVWAGSRGGILSTAVLLVLIPMVWLAQGVSGNTKRYAVLWIAVPVAVIAVLLKSGDISRWFMSLGKFDSRGVFSGDRLKIWGAYFEAMSSNPLYFLLGAPLKEIPQITVIGDNCHNSFLQLHAFNGIIPLVLFTALGIGAAVRYIRQKDYLTLSLLAVITLRGMTDKFIFSQYGMPVMLYLVFYPFVRTETGETAPETKTEKERTEPCTENLL